MTVFLKKSLKFFLVFVAMVALLGAVIFLSYDILYFQPHRSQINEIYEVAHIEDKNPPASVRAFLEARDHNIYVAAGAAKLLIKKLNIWKPEDGQLQWHIKNALWSALVTLHIPSDKIYGLICILSYNGKGNGLNALSERIFSKPLSKLSSSEAASVVAITVSPARYLNSPKDMIKQRDRLIQRVQDSRVIQ